MKLTPAAYKRMVRITQFVNDLHTLSNSTVAQKWPAAWKLGQQYNWEAIIYRAIKGAGSNSLDDKWTKPFV